MRTVPLASDILTIGRLAECEVASRTRERRGNTRRSARDGTYAHRSRLDERHAGERPDVQSRELADGDKITVGTTQIEFRRGLAASTPFALSALKYGLFALLFLFIWRAMRWVVRGLNVEASPSRRTARPAAAPARGPTGPSVLVVHPTRSQGAHASDGST